MWRPPPSPSAIIIPWISACITKPPPQINAEYTHIYHIQPIHSLYLWKPSLPFLHYLENPIFTHVGEPAPPKSTFQPPPRADSVAGRGCSLSPCPGCCCLQYLFKIPAPGAWPALVFAQAHWGPAGDSGAMAKLLSEPHSNLFFFFFFSPSQTAPTSFAFCLLFYFFAFLCFSLLCPHAFPSLFFCFAFPPPFAFSLFFKFFFFPFNVEACKQPGLLSQLGIRGEKPPFWAHWPGFLPFFLGLGGILLPKEGITWVSKFPLLKLLLLHPTECPTNIHNAPKRRFSQNAAGLWLGPLEKWNYAASPLFWEKRQRKLLFMATPGCHVVSVTWSFAAGAGGSPEHQPELCFKEI